MFCADGYGRAVPRAVCDGEGAVTMRPHAVMIPFHHEGTRIRTNEDKAFHHSDRTETCSPNREGGKGDRTFPAVPSIGVDSCSFVVSGCMIPAKPEQCSRKGERTPPACGVRRRAEHLRHTTFPSPFGGEKNCALESSPGRQRQHARRVRSQTNRIVRAKFSVR